MNFINQFVGTFNYTTSAEVEDRIKEQVVLVLYDVLGDAKNKGLGVADLAANLTNLEQALLERCKPHFDLYGILIDKLSGLYINLPEEVQKAVDTRASMGVTRHQLHAVPDRPGHARGGPEPVGRRRAGAGVGVGAGIGMGYMMMDQMRQGMQPAAPAATAATAAAAAGTGAGRDTMS